MEPTLSRLRQLVGDLEAWTTSHARTTVLAIVLVSALVRVAYFAEILASPCATQHRWAESDMNFFDGWARGIAAGDVLTDVELHPYHGWNRGIAAGYLRLHPEDGALAASVVPGEEPGRVVWNRWYGGKTFHQEPLYPYLVAATYALLGPDVRWVFAWQLAAGIVTNVLVFAIARRLFGPLAGALAGLLAVLCAPLVYYEMILLRETLIVTASLALVYFGLRAFEERTWRAWIVFGVAGGIALLVKSVFVTTLAIAALVAVWRWRREPSSVWRAVGGLAAGVIVCLAPAFARNLAVGAPTLSLSAVGPVVFASANTVDYPPEAGFFASATYLPRIMGESQGAAWPTVVAALRTHPDVASYVDLVRRKLSVMWRWYEVPNNTNYYYYRLHSVALRWLPIGFTIAAPLGLLGMILGWKHRRDAWFLYWSVATSVATMLCFYVLSRFRAPLLAACLPFAAFAIVEIVRWVLEGRRVRAILVVLATGALVVWTARPLPANASPIRYSDWLAAYQYGYGPRLNEALQRSDWRTITEILDRSLEIEPEEIDRIVATGELSQPNDVLLARLYMQIYEQHVYALRQVNRAADAQRSESRLQRLRSLVPAAPTPAHETLKPR